MIQKFPLYGIFTKLKCETFLTPKFHNNWDSNIKDLEVKPTYLVSFNFLKPGGS